MTPYVVAQDAAGLIDFVKQAFGAEEIFRSVGSAGGIHAEVRIGDSMLMMGGGGPGLAWRGKSKPLAFHYLRARLRRDLQTRAQGRRHVHR